MATRYEDTILQHASDSGADSGAEGNAGTILTGILLVGVAFLFFGANDNLPDPDDEDDFWEKMFNPDWLRPGH